MLVQTQQLSEQAPESRDSIGEATYRTRLLLQAVLGQLPGILQSETQRNPFDKGTSVTNELQRRTPRLSIQSTAGPCDNLTPFKGWSPGHFGLLISPNHSCNVSLLYSLLVSLNRLPRCLPLLNPRSIGFLTGRIRDENLARKTARGRMLRLS